MHPLIFIVILGAVHALDIKEIKNPILPVYIGRTKIISSKHTFLYHINLTNPEISIYQIKNSLTKLHSTINNQQPLNHFSIIISNKVLNAISLADIIFNKISTFSDTLRIKRGLINGIGKMQKWLFGTLDSEDEEHITSYFQILQSNENELFNKLKTQQSILKQISNEYINNFKNLKENQLILEGQIKYLTKEINEFINLEQAFSFSNTIDNLLMQLQTIEHMLNNLEIAISFARLNILHSSIIKPNQIKLILDKLNKLYGTNQVILFDKLFSYYSLFSTQVMIKNKIILFKVHTPIMYSQFKNFQLYPIPILNQTIIPEQPYLLLNTEDYWTTSEKCPAVENFYFCLQENLHKNQPCLADLIRTGKNSCQGTTINFSETSSTQINSKEVLVIPTNTTKIKSSCATEGIYEISKPCVIVMGKCKIIINGKTYQAEQSTNEEYIFDLPAIEVPTSSNSQKKRTFHLKKIDEESINRLNAVMDNLQVTNLHTFHSSSHSWTNTSLIMVAVMVTVAAIYYLRIYRKRRENHLKKPDAMQKTVEPLFSALGREELCT